MKVMRWLVVAFLIAVGCVAALAGDNPSAVLLVLIAIAVKP